MAKLTTVLSIVWIVTLAITEFVVGERVGIAAFVAYLPQHLFIVPILLSVLTSAAARNLRLIAANIGLIVIFLFVFMGLNLSIPQKADSNAIKVITWNLHSTSSVDSVLAVINKEKPDIVFFQEVKSGNPVLQKMKSMGWHAAQASDVAVFTHHPLANHQSYKMLPGSGRRAILGTVKIGEKPFDVVGVHFATNLSGATRSRPVSYLRGSAKSRTMQVKQLLQLAERQNTIIAGDFNTPPRGIAYRRISSAYRDAFQQGNGFGYTYRTDLPVIRIDHIFVSRDLRPVSCKTIKNGASDHFAVVAEIQLPQP